MAKKDPLFLVVVDESEEMHHALSETVRDDEAQILFQSQQPEFSVVCLVEVRIERCEVAPL